MKEEKIKWVLGKVEFKKDETIPYARKADINRIRLFRYEEEKDVLFTIDDVEYVKEAVNVLAELPEKAYLHITEFYQQQNYELLKKSEKWLVKQYNRIVDFPKEMRNETE